jgi:hypothetical protein
MPIDPHRQNAITAAVGTHIATHRRPWLTPVATRLLVVMFADSDLCYRNLDSLATEGFSKWTLARLLRGQIEAGLVSKERGKGSAPNTYQLHLPPRRQP